MEFYRQRFPDATVIPKMHFLEHHVIQWLKKWHIASGLMGEQGAESLHAHIHNLETRFCGVANDLERLKYVVKEHNVQSSPEIRDLQPPPKKFKKHSSQ